MGPDCTSLVSDVRVRVAATIVGALYAPRMPQVTSGFGEESWDDLVKRARDNDEAAWVALCQRLKKVAWKTINRFRMPIEDRKDVFAVTFLRLFTHIHTIEQPDRLHLIFVECSNEAMMAEVCTREGSRI